MQLKTIKFALLRKTRELPKDLDETKLEQVGTPIFK